MNRIGAVLLIFCVFMLGCRNSQKSDVGSGAFPDRNPKGDLILFHAGSLSVPMKEISAAFTRENPGVNILMEAGGSLECARKITELKKPCDVMVSADYTVIDNLLIPAYAGWNIKFASNEMAIVYSEKSKRGREISSENWYKILLDKNVQIGRADPDSDPCGYRTVLVCKLAGNYYRQDSLSSQLLKKDRNNIRPKEVDLIALLESGNIDYIFIYRSVAEQHKLKYILLPDEINLKNPEFADLYSKVTVQISGKKPGETMVQGGEPMVYGITVPNNAPNRTVALAFVKFMLTKEKGMAILGKLGQPSVIPSSTNTYNSIPEDLKPFARPPKE